MSCALFPAMAASKDDVAQQLARTKAQLVQMQTKLDNWLLNAAEREEEVERQLAGRDARIAELSVLLSKERERVVTLRAAVSDSEWTGHTANRDPRSAGGAEPGLRHDQRTLEAELSDLRQDARASQLESEALRSYVQQLEAGIKQRDDAVRSAREVVLASRRELDSRALKIERLRKELQSARARPGNSDGGPLKTRHSLIREVSMAGSGAPQPDAGVRDDPQTVPQSTPPDALRQAKAGARASALDYLRLRDQDLPADGQTRPDRPEVHQAFRKMFAHQARVANLTGARGLYQVRSQDTLSLIAGHTTGDQANWPALFTANAHLMASPDQLIDGLVLIIPSP